MNTNALKKFAQETRRKLMQQVAAKLEFVTTNDTPELREKAEQVKKLKEALQKHGKEQLIDKVAYTWFNRFMALRFMDANDYQPLGVLVLSPLTGQTTPEILNQAKQGDIPAELKVNQQKVMDLLDGRTPSSNPQNEAYKELLIASCNHLHTVLPFLFERINDYTELLLPDDLTSQFSILTDVVAGMTEEDCKEVEIIGWLYQFYISEKKDEVFASKSKVKKEDIPAATQLFTPRWIVEYMVQNTLGKLWLQNKPNSKLREHMPYFIESSSLEGEDYLKVSSPEEIKLLDQACGSGHILVYGFDLLTKIYEEEGYSQIEIAQLILTKNLYGFEIDDRAAQLAGMALLMKARSYQRRLFKKDEVPAPTILCYRDLLLTAEEIKATLLIFGIKASEELLHDFRNVQQATNLGSLILPHAHLNEINSTLGKIAQTNPGSDAFYQYQLNQLKDALKQLQLLADKYHCVVDNPPYMGGGNMNTQLADFVKINYPNSKADLMACFMESGLKVLHPKGFLGMINQHTWMFLSSYEALRKKLIEDTFFDTLLHLGPRTFPEIGGEVVQNAAFTFWNTLSDEKGAYIRLVDFDKTEIKRDNAIQAIQNPDCGWYYIANQKEFEKIPGSPIGYWLSDNALRTFQKFARIDEIADLKQGMATTNNDLFMRRWFECPLKASSFTLGSPERTFKEVKWVPYSKGGSARKWFGNQEYLVNFENNGQTICEYIDNTPGVKVKSNGRVINRISYFKPALTWSLTSSGGFCVRFRPEGSVFDVNGMSLIVKNSNDFEPLIALMNSKVAYELLKTINPTLAFQKGDIEKLPATLDFIPNVDIKNVIETSRLEWDSHETSWDFIQNELIRQKSESIEESYDLYQQYWRNKFFQLHKNEEELNRQFIEIYGLQDELTPDVPLEEITILKEETIIDNGQLVFHADAVFKQFVSYAVGCMFGRYSLDKEGLILANQGETLEDYLTKIEKSRNEVAFLPDEDNIIPVLDDDWFEDDIVGRFYAFLKASFGEANFQKNLAFVEECLGKDMRKFFTKDFYDDHIKRYKKRPIYWMFSSPKGSFSVLVYMHRYTPDTLNNILNKYLREFIGKLKIRKEHLEQIKISGSAAEQSKAIKEIDKLDKMLLDCQEYEREILYNLATERIAIGLDDGVLVNYNKFGKAIKEVKGLNDTATKKKVKEFDWIDGSKIK
jgi:type II restriction/modification system DNA methylase subunit YeeA